jgi:hypothetical protein
VNGVDRQVRLYLHDTLGAEAVVAHWDLSTQLPYFLQDAYEFRSAEIAGHRVLLVIDHHRRESSGRDLHVQLARVADLANLPVVYVVDALSSYERRRLVEQKIPFIVPGNQLYLPMLGVDFRERFRRRPEAEGRSLSPATQAVLINALMRKVGQADWAPADIAAELGYGAMTASRAAGELAASGIATVVVRGRQRLLRLAQPPGRMWEASKSAFRSPVKRVVWAALPAMEFASLDVMPAGQSALALCSSISEPKRPVYAMSAATWSKAEERGARVLPEPEPGATEWQIWNYGPRVAGGAQRVVDPLSLALSLRDSPDERIQMALGKLKERFPWSEA